jgi:hypothetical protein
MNQNFTTTSEDAHVKKPRIRSIPPEISHAYLTGDINGTTTLNIPDILPAPVEIKGKSGRIYSVVLEHVDYMTDEENEAFSNGQPIKTEADDNKIKVGTTGVMERFIGRRERPSGTCRRCKMPFYSAVSTYYKAGTKILTCHGCGLQVPSMDMYGVPNEQYAIDHEIPASRW